ncbi:C-type lectin domain family 17, member A-like isoform X2 [Dreissena polymorpha]|uniref:C-type lectin domain-containing protein n=1 Tax=Dreissena polymorpha TaxID=45954 RepID=A0A9D4HA11_DREPO|nr:C-type lectin domain family 17, member A-like isoform X1 [Dreissena polymorpha]XP_052252139.1 C-type lectin domain family 17, member A-like isoform X2 [Dreissena polymorpha]KAH3713081.1 hypothetical protein DPMN_072848 [Dreissena polymorpha]
MSRHSVLTFLVSLGLASCAGARCPDGFLTHGEKCYHFSHDTETYSGARAICSEDLGNGYLVEIDSMEENNFLAGEAKRLNQYYRIGLNDLAEEGQWVWSHSLRHAEFTKWTPGEPDNWTNDENCAQLRPDGDWNDIPCSQLKNYICETDASQEPRPVG